MRHYRGFIADSARWAGFEHRDDDIVIATPAKSGTTWMQNIVGMLVLGTPDLGRPITEISPWLDMLTRPLDEVVAMLEAQEHRRFIKTHTPLDGLPFDERVTYISVLRHPLQVALSDVDHGRNADRDVMIPLRGEVAGFDDLADLPPPPERSDDPRERMQQWLDDPTDYGSPGGTVSLAQLLTHARTYWDARDRPNVHLFHYSDLRRDLAGQMRRVAEVLAVPIPDDFETFVEAATFDRMKAAADRTAPDAEFGTWKSNSDFFRSPEDRTWDFLTEDDLAHFESRLLELAGPDLAAFMCNGERS
ncbi:sulfotransferase domain-containing protein [Actinospongicola halichondriae]|uniref:sulfotransferase domain-containing protein n=1 Tax=Actinospongicola halichondriae TaxID=3236844 RepID=UPI003D3F7203